MTHDAPLRNASHVDERGVRVTRFARGRWGEFDQPPSILEAAQGHALAGRLILPLSLGGDPLVPREAASRDDAQLRAWFDVDDSPSAGIVLGIEHGIVGIECDLSTAAGVRAATVLRGSSATIATPDNRLVVLVDPRGPWELRDAPAGVTLLHSGAVVAVPPSVLIKPRGSGRCAWAVLSRVRQLSQSTFGRLTRGQNREEWE